MIERAARALAALEDGQDWPSNAELGGNLTGTRDDEYRDAMRDTAREMLDAVLPQITTIAELEALPLRTLLIDEHGGEYRIGFHAHDSIERALPLTVVWQPEAGDRS